MIHAKPKHNSNPKKTWSSWSGWNRLGNGNSIFFFSTSFRSNIPNTTITPMPITNCQGFDSPFAKKFRIMIIGTIRKSWRIKIPVVKFPRRELISLFLYKYSSMIAELLKLIMKLNSTTRAVDHSKWWPIIAMKAKLSSNWTIVPTNEVRKFFTNAGTSISAPIKNICMIKPSVPICAIVLASLKNLRPNGPSKTPATIYALK